MNNYNDLIKLILKNKYKYIFFDVFFTTIKYPFSDFNQLYYLMEKNYNKSIHTNTTFQHLRNEAEAITIKNENEDNRVNNNLTIEKIYNCLNREFKVDRAICKELIKVEEEIILELSSPRTFIKHIYDIAIKFNKRIFFISNTYYKHTTIKNILKLNGFTKYDNIFLASDIDYRKYSKTIFEYSIEQLNANAHNILYFCGIQSTIEIAESLGTKTILIPKTTDILKSITTESLPNLSIISNDYINTSGFNFVTSIIANRFFDNPFHILNRKSMYNYDPYFFGYYALGMHLLSIAYWVINESSKYSEILFLSRDGYLVKKAFDIIKNTSYLQNFPKSKYIYISRRLMMPFIISDYSDLLDFPSLNVCKSTPKKMIELLEFCTKPISRKELKDFYQYIEMSENEPFLSKNRYYSFIKEYYKRFYNGNKHTYSKRILNEYFKSLSDNSISFDLGNYGRVQSALVKAAKKSIDALFLFSNTDISFIETQKNNYKIKTFYDFYPRAHRSFREYLFSSDEPSCIGIN